MSTLTVADDANGVPSAPEFEQFFREHYQLVYRTAYSVTGRVEDAEDIVQSVFLRLLRRESPLDLGRNPKGYLYRAALNLALDTIRRRRRHVLVRDNAFFESATRVVDVRETDDLDSRLWKAISALQPSSAQILILRYVHDHSLAEIARLLGSTRGTIAVSLFRSRARLKKIIRAHSGGKS
jgi:RNA polymerase sigma-70 factor (ECF subfamily)